MNMSWICSWKTKQGLIQYALQSLHKHTDTTQVEPYLLTISEQWSLQTCKKRIQLGGNTITERREIRNPFHSYDLFRKSIYIFSHSCHKTNLDKDTHTHLVQYVLTSLLFAVPCPAGTKSAVVRTKDIVYAKYITNGVNLLGHRTHKQLGTYAAFKTLRRSVWSNPGTFLVGN